MFAPQSDTGHTPVLPGITLKTLVHGEKTLFAEFRMKQGSQLPRHAHPHEQTGYLVQGRIRLTLGAESFEVTPGGSWAIPGNLEHSAEILEDSVAIEVFSPLREDYLKYHCP